MDWLSSLNPFAAVGGAIGAISTSVQNARMRDFQREMFDKQTAYNTAERIAAQQYNTSERQAVQAYNQSMYEQYNSYGAQFRQLKSLGVNPNAISNIVSGVPMGTSQPMSVQGSSAGLGTANPLPIGHYLSDIVMNSADARLKNAQAESQEKDNQYKDEFNRLTNKEIEERIGNISSDTALKQSMKGLSDAQQQQAIETAKALAAKTPEEVKQIQAAINQATQQIELMKAQGRHISDQDLEQQYRNGLWEQGINPDNSAMDNLLKMCIQYLASGNANLVGDLFQFVFRNFFGIH